MLLSVGNHLGDLLGVGNELCQAHFYPITTGVPKWFLRQQGPQRPSATHNSGDRGTRVAIIERGSLEDLEHKPFPARNPKRLPSVGIDSTQIISTDRSDR